MSEDWMRDKFGGSLRGLNYVPRWTSVPFNRTHNTAQHSFWVILYSQVIADFLGLTFYAKAEILDYALRHDLPEVASGDILGPVKRSAVDKNKLLAFVYASFKSWGVWQFLQGLEAVDPKVQNIVKAADIIDDLMVLSEEMALGNQRAEKLFLVIAQRLQKALMRISCNELFEPVMASCAVVRESPLTIIQEDSDVK